MNLTIDRFEGDYAVCQKEDGRMINIPNSVLPAGVKEGDILIELNGNFTVDVAGTHKQKADIAKLMDDVFE